MSGNNGNNDDFELIAAAMNIGEGGGELEAALPQQVRAVPVMGVNHREDNVDRELELERRIWRDTVGLRRMRDARRAVGGGGGGGCGDVVDAARQQAVRRRLILRAQDELMQLMVEMMEDGGAQGFIFGIILENGRLMCRASDNPREWWKEEERFGRAWLAAIAKYQSEHPNAVNNV